MLNMTKKEFLKLHKAGKFNLIQACYGKNKEFLYSLIKELNQTFEGTKTSRIDVSNQGDYLKVRIFHEDINNQVFVFVEETIDNSKNNQCSWDTIEVNTMIYVRNDL